MERPTPQSNALDLASSTYFSQVRVVSHSREPLRVEVAFWQMNSLSQTARFPPKHPFPAVEGAEGDVTPSASLIRSSLELMSHLYRILSTER